MLAQFGFDFNALIAKAIEVHAEHDGKILLPGAAVANPINAFSLGMALMFGTAGLPHILMRFFTVGNAKEARKSVFWATTFIGYFYILTFIIGFGAIVLVLTNPALSRRRRHQRRCSAAATCRRSISPTPSAAT